MSDEPFPLTRRGAMGLLGAAAAGALSPGAQGSGEPATPAPPRQAAANLDTTQTPTVRAAVYDVLRRTRMTTIFGNPGSTEIPFLGDFPGDFRYVLALQEASAVAMADGFAQASKGAAFVNLHSAAGLGNGLGNVFTAFRNRTPLVITAGQQARSLLPFDPYLGADRPTEFPRPYVKWALEPNRAEDVPVAIAQAYAIAMEHPRGPTFVSIPMDDWNAAAGPTPMPAVRGEFAPDAAAVATLLKALTSAKNPVLVVGAAVDRSGAFEQVVQLAERVGAPVWEAPVASRASFPEDHPLFAGFLPAVPEALSERLDSFDLILVIGAPMFSFHESGRAVVLEDGRQIWQITEDPREAARGWSANAMVSAIPAAVDALLQALPAVVRTVTPHRETPSRLEPQEPMLPAFVMQQVAAVMSKETVVVEEAPSHRPAMQKHLPIRTANSFYTMASGGLGWGLPAAVGIALAERRRVLCLIGDGSMMYSVQALWTAAQHRLPLTVVVLNNRGYGAMRDFSKVLHVGVPPGIDLPGIDFKTLAASLGVPGQTVAKAADLNGVLSASLAANGPVLVEVPVDPNASEIY